MDLNNLKQQLEIASKSIDVKNRELSDMENSATDKFYNDIKGYVNHERYKNIKEYIKIITNKECKINCLILEGEQGIGKSTIVKSMLKEMNKDMCYINSYTTSLSFYKTLYVNRFKTIVLDDVFGIFGDEKGIAILRAITNTENVRYVKYDSTSDKLDVPSNFNFEGNVIILTNELTPAMNDSLLNRAIHRRIVFSLEEKFEFMENIAKFNFPKIDLKEVMNYIKKNVDETTRNFTFRSVIKIVEFYKHNKQKWKNMALEELEKDDELILLKGIINKNKEVSKQVDEFILLTGKSRRTFFNEKKKLVQKCNSAGNSNLKIHRNRNTDNTILKEVKDK